jgi:hypothetical protein
MNTTLGNQRGNAVSLSSLEQALRKDGMPSPPSQWVAHLYVPSESRDQGADSGREAEVSGIAEECCVWFEVPPSNQPPSKELPKHWLVLPIGVSQDLHEACPAASPLAEPAVSVTPAELGNEEWMGIFPELGPIPEDSELRRTLQRDLEQLADDLASSRVLRIEHTLWWAIPSSAWRPASALLTSYSTPDEVIARDWQHQLEQKPGGPHETLVSPHGLLASLHPLLPILRERQAASSVTSIIELLEMEVITPQPSQWPEGIANIPQGLRASTKLDTNDGPSATSTVPFVMATQSRHTATRNRKRKPSPSMQRVAMSMAGIAAMLLLVWSLLPAPTRSVSSSDGHETATHRTRDGAASALPATESVVSEDATSFDEVETAEPLASTSLESLAEIASYPALDPDVAHAHLDLRMPSIAVPLADPFAADPEPIDAPKPDGVASPFEPEAREDIAAMAEDADEARKRTITIALDRGPERTETKFGRGVVMKRAQCDVRLEMEEEMRQDVVVRPEETQSILGIGHCEYSLAIEDEDPELIVQVWSKPATRWQLAIQYGARLAPSLPPVRFTPHEIASIVQRLTVHEHGIVETMGVLRNAPRASPAMRGIDVPSQIRWLQSQQRATAQAIQQWGVIAELCDTLTVAGKMEVELSVRETDAR